MATMTLEPSNLFIVADGMGGQQAGEQASLMAVELIPRAIARRLAPEETEPNRIKEAIREAVAEVNQEILGSSGAVTEFTNMGTTVVLAQFRNDRVFVAGIGDSRAYRLRDGRLERLTKDHSLADALLEAGTISPEELPTHKFKNVLYLYLGSKDARGGPEDVRVLDVRPGDRLLMASDGLTGVVPDAELKHVLATIDDPQQAAVTLKDMALANDSKDNVTCLIIHAVAQQPHRRPAPPLPRRRDRPGSGPPSSRGCPADRGLSTMLRLEDFTANVVKSGLVPAEVAGPGPGRAAAGRGRRGGGPPGPPADPGQAAHRLPGQEAPLGQDQRLLPGRLSPAPPPGRGRHGQGLPGRERPGRAGRHQGAPAPQGDRGRERPARDSAARWTSRGDASTPTSPARWPSATRAMSISW